jgi:hypothetical protein
VDQDHQALEVVMKIKNEDPTADQAPALAVMMKVVVDLDQAQVAAVVVVAVVMMNQAQVLAVVVDPEVGLDQMMIAKILAMRKKMKTNLNSNHPNFKA